MERHTSAKEFFAPRFVQIQVNRTGSSFEPYPDTDEEDVNKTRKEPVPEGVCAICSKLATVCDVHKQTIAMITEHNINQIACMTEKMKEEELEKLHRDIGMTFYSFTDCDDIENFVPEKKELSNYYKEDDEYPFYDGYTYDNMNNGTDHESELREACGSGDGKEKDVGKGKIKVKSDGGSQRNNFCLEFHGNSREDDCTAVTRLCGL